MEPGTKLKAHIIDVGDTEYNPDSISLRRPWGDGSKAFPKVKGTMSAEWPSIKYYYENAVYGDGRHQAFLSLQQTSLTQIPPLTDMKASHHGMCRLPARSKKVRITTKNTASATANTR